MLKATGCVVAMASAVDPGLLLIIVGAGLGIIHGIIKLIYVCMTAASDLEAEDEHGANMV